MNSYVCITYHILGLEQSSEAACRYDVSLHVLNIILCAFLFVMPPSKHLFVLFFFQI